MMTKSWLVVNYQIRIIQGKFNFGTFSQNFTFCVVSNLTDFPIPYNDKFFSYQNDELVLINDNLTI